MHTTDHRRPVRRELLFALLARRGRIVLDITAYRWLRSAGFRVRDVDRAAADLVATGRAALNGMELVAVPATEGSTAA